MGQKWVAKTPVWKGPICFIALKEHERNVCIVLECVSQKQYDDILISKERDNSWINSWVMQQYYIVCETLTSFIKTDLLYTADVFYLWLERFLAYKMQASNIFQTKPLRESNYANNTATLCRGQLRNIDCPIAWKPNQVDKNKIWRKAHGSNFAYKSSCKKT